MITRVPTFIRGTDFKELAPNRSHYRFQSLRSITVELDKPAVAKPVSFRDGDGKEWLRIEGRKLTVAAGYAWNGCSPKRHVPILGWIGTPDFPATILGSLVHDALYQFRGVERFPFDRATCDFIFLRILQLSGFALANAWYGAVRDFGGIAKWQPTNGEHSVPLDFP